MDTIELCEVGPRDGFQFEERPIPTDRKIGWIRALAASGLPRVQMTSFVHPKWVPQMADAEEVAAALLEGAGTSGGSGAPGSAAAPDGNVVFSGLALNVRGVERAAAAGLGVVDLSIATNEKHGRDNANMCVEQGAAQAEIMLERAAQLGLRAQLGLQTVWGYGSPGDTPLSLITDLARRFAGRGLESFSLADSTGLAHPPAIRRVLDAVLPLVDAPLVLHLHDTRGLGVANILAAAEAGVSRFDTSLGGLGGCPFIPGATGNVATEDVIWALEGSGFATGVDLDAVAQVTREVADFLGRRLPGKLYGLG